MARTYFSAVIVVLAASVVAAAGAVPQQSELAVPRTASSYDRPQTHTCVAAGPKSITIDDANKPVPTKDCVWPFREGSHIWAPGPVMPEGCGPAGAVDGVKIPPVASHIPRAAEALPPHIDSKTIEVYGGPGWRRPLFPRPTPTLSARGDDDSDEVSFFPRPRHCQLVLTPRQSAGFRFGGHSLSELAKVFVSHSEPHRARLTTAAISAPGATVQLASNAAVPTTFQTQWKVPILP